MRLIPWFLILVAFGCTAVIARHGLTLIGGPIAPLNLTASAIDPPTEVARIGNARRYVDDDYDFSVAVPAGWQPIVTLDEPDNEQSVLTDGYAVGFEAPRDGPVDRFADYVLIEILPGSGSGKFLTDGSRARPVSIGGLSGTRESLRVDGYDMGAGELDLVVHQAEVRGTGFTIGFYAIGQPARRALLDDAFELMIRTFDLHRPPFRIS